MKTIWSTRRALSVGISEMEVIKIESRYVKAVERSYPNGWLLLGRGEWYETLDDAKARVERMRKDKIKSLEKQIAKLREYKPAIRPLT